MYHAEVSLAGQQNHHRAARIAMDTVLRGLRTGVAVERHDEDADGGVRPDALRERLALLPLCEENAREIAERVPKQIIFCKM